MSAGKKVFFIFFTIIIFVAVYFGYRVYTIVYSQNVSTSGDKYFYVPINSTFDDLIDSLNATGCIMNIQSFEQLAKLKKFTNVKPGKYKLTNGMTNNDVVNMLRSGNQVPVKVTFISVRNLETLAGKVATNIEVDSVSILNVLNSDSVISQYGFTRETFCSMFIPNTYEFWWSTTAEEFVARMAEEYKKFWTVERKGKAKELGLTQSQVSTLASIVESETQQNSERPRVAGVYVNRLRKGWLLQADPTVKFAVGDPSLKRILNKHLEIDSPYNTYKHTGLPPGPICIPSTSSLEAVLNYEQHSYMYFCAKEDFSGYHNFSVTNSQHAANARKYHEALRKAGIK